MPQSACPKLKQHMLEMLLLMIQKMFKEHSISNEAWNTVGTKQARLTPLAQGCQDGKPIKHLAITETFFPDIALLLILQNHLALKTSAFPLCCILLPILSLARMDLPTSWLSVTKENLRKENLWVSWFVNTTASHHVNMSLMFLLFLSSSLPGTWRWTPGYSSPTGTTVASHVKKPSFFL